MPSPAPTVVLALHHGNRCEFDYTNYRGETARRRFVPTLLYFGATEHHPEPQWLVRGWDADKGAERDYALAGIKAV